MPQAGIRPGFVQDSNAAPVYQSGQQRQAAPRLDPFVPVAEMVRDTRGEGFLIVRSSEQRVSSNGSKYVDMTLSDRTGEINAKVWDTLAEPPAVGTVLRVRAQIQEYNGRIQMRVDKMRPANEQDDVRYDALIPCAPEDPNAMLAEIRAAADAMEDSDLRRLTHALLDDAGDALLTVPAAQKLHHAERGGLLRHTVGMLRLARSFAELYPALDRDLLIAGVVAHDLAKLNELTVDSLGLVKEYSADGFLIGHLVRGIVNIELAARRIGVTSQRVLLLQHMVLSHHGEPEFGSPRRPMFIEAEILHIIDLADARINEMSSGIAKLKPGGFSERIWSLDRRLYRFDNAPNDPKEESKP
ncbi:MAG: HD domain-containing protein [Oscillospiraceae bacterium]|nr:HD domain-containing protein [Oscillospiraceae bacterium]